MWVRCIVWMAKNLIKSQANRSVNNSFSLKQIKYLQSVWFLDGKHHYLFLVNYRYTYRMYIHT